MRSTRIGAGRGTVATHLALVDSTRVRTDVYYDKTTTKSGPIRADHALQVDHARAGRRAG